MPRGVGARLCSAGPCAWRHREGPWGLRADGRRVGPGGPEPLVAAASRSAAAGPSGPESCRVEGAHHHPPRHVFVHLRSRLFSTLAFGKPAPSASRTASSQDSRRGCRWHCVERTREGQWPAGSACARRVASVPRAGGFRGRVSDAAAGEGGAALTAPRARVGRSACVHPRGCRHPSFGSEETEAQSGSGRAAGHAGSQIRTWAAACRFWALDRRGRPPGVLDRKSGAGRRWRAAGGEPWHPPPSLCKRTGLSRGVFVVAQASLRTQRKELT